MEIKGIPYNALPVTDPQIPAAAKPARQGGPGAASAKKVGREFEAMFVGMMLKSMRDTVGKDKLTGGGHGEETFRSLLDQEYASAAAASGSLGLAAAIEKELTKRPLPVQGNAQKGVGSAD